MAIVTEAARVAAVDDDGYAWVETLRKATCDSCSVQKGCGAGILSKLFNRRMARIRVLNTLDASVGDDVVLGIEDGMLVKASVAVYVVPLLWMLAAAIGGGMIAESLQWGNAEGASALSGLLGLAGGFWWLRRHAARNATQGTLCQPSLLGFVEKEQPGAGDVVIVPAEHVGRHAAGGGKGPDSGIGY